MVDRRLRPLLQGSSKFKMPGGLFPPYTVLAFRAFIIRALAIQPDTLASPFFTPT
ncbi:hypothetical protein [Paeniglutamicibacter gangotriensis]|uniref:hypothetical protein n=1 Tax=Paeniglutamicibacter gangotriensis TaxID=254787 RepID=UPI00165FEC93|nr:hypothetical protein [Paeniglutamicibacter gangotriensis]